MHEDIFNESSSFDDDSLNIDLLSQFSEEFNEDNMSSKFTPLNPQSSFTLTPLETEIDKYIYEWFDTDNQSSNNASSLDSYETKKTRKKRGRQNDKTEAQHTPFKNDCKMAKIQISYFTFLIILLNIIMKKLKLKYTFLQFHGKYKSNVNQKFRASLNKKTIKEIIEDAPISAKYKKGGDNANIIQKLTEQGQDMILQILDKNFLFFFENVYFSNIKKFNLSSFGLSPFDVELPPKTKLFKDLLNKEKNNYDNFNEYKEKMEKCAERYFFSKSNDLNDDISS